MLLCFFSLIDIMTSFSVQCHINGYQMSRKQDKDYQSWFANVCKKIFQALLMHILGTLPQNEPLFK